MVAKLRIHPYVLCNKSRQDTPCWTFDTVLPPGQQNPRDGKASVTWTSEQEPAKDFVLRYISSEGECRQAAPRGYTL